MSTTPSCDRPMEEERFGGFRCERRRKIGFNARTGDFVLNEDDVWVDPPNEDNDISARDCMGWEEDMVKNGEYFLMNIWIVLACLMHGLAAWFSTRTTFRYNPRKCINGPTISRLLS
jgi:hypothetical protein